MDAPLKPSPRLKRLEEMADRFRMLSEPSRLRILDAIGEDEVNVQEICERTGFKQANVSRHLRLLRDIQAIACRQTGHYHYYRVIDPIVLRCWHCTKEYCEEIE